MSLVLVTFRDGLPNSLDRGSLGVFSVRRYTVEPLRCFKYQVLELVQKHCGTREHASCVAVDTPTLSASALFEDGSAVPRSA